MDRVFAFFASFLLLCSCTTPDQTDDRFRVLTYNVYYGFTKVSERKPNWLQWMKDQQADVVALQELNEYTPDQLAEDAQFWGHPYAVLLKENGFPTGITSRYPIEDIQRYLDGFHHGLIRVKINNIYFYVIHLHPSNWEIRHREIDRILVNISELPEGSPVILAGDFNTFSPQDSTYYTHGRLEVFFRSLDSLHQSNNLNNGQLDYGVIQKVTDAGFIDLEYSLRPANYLFTGSFPGLIEKEGEHGDLRRLDYIFVNAALKNAVTRAIIVANDTTQYLSDHLPVIADFALESR